MSIGESGDAGSSSEVVTECAVACGECCRRIRFPVRYPRGSYDWMRWHGVDVEEVYGIPWVTLHNPCEKLVGDVCTIYPNRPFGCKTYQCEKSREYERDRKPEWV